MIQKIVSVVNVGRFRNCRPVGDVRFRAATLIYAPNGRGKTTLCDVLRSLKTGVSDGVEGRKTLDSDGKPKIELLVEDSIIRFQDGTWSETLSDIEVYDSRFVYENVYAGECVGHEQRRNLYSVIIGERGVALREKVDELDDELRKAGREASIKETAVRVIVPDDVVEVGVFVLLEEDLEVDAKIEETRKFVAALSSATELKTRSLLQKVTLPAFPEGLETLLGKSLEDVAEDAEETIREHMAEHMTQPDEQWLVDGLALVREDGCPFCAQSLRDNDLLSAYKTHFAGKYQELKKEISRWASNVERFAEKSVVVGLERSTAANARLLTEWREYVSIDKSPALDIDQVSASLTELREEALELVREKAKTPLEKIEVNDAFRAAAKSVEGAYRLVNSHNTTVDFVNDVLRAKQEEAGSGNLNKVKSALAKLEATKARQTDEAKRACKDYIEALALRKKLEIKKQEARRALDDYSRDVFQRYEKRINRLLKDFGATFRIQKTGERYKGGKPSTTYCLAIEGKEVELGDAKTPLSGPSFKNTLSAGDKSALALAFFLVRLESSIDLHRKVVVLDDPFTSQDASRQTCTHQEIRRLVREASQVVVLSHDRRFLKRVWDGLEAGATRTLQFSALGDTTITEWDIERVQDEYIQTFTILWLYCNRNEGDPQLVVRTIRPLLEGYLRMKLPNEFRENGWLGDYVRQIRESDQNSPSGQARGILTELEDLKDYAKRYHHPAGAEAPDDPVDAAEVLAFGKRALDLVQAF